MTDKILFGGSRYWWMSNFAAFPILRKGAIRRTSEHIYQAEKFESLEMQERIYTSLSPHDAKTLARGLQTSIRSEWFDIRNEVMYSVLKAKAEQHPYVMRKLLETGDATIIENSPWDGYWGNGKDGTGKNMLGKTWMKTREYFRQRDGGNVEGSR
jgi:N-glycosidase YbiA